MSIVRRVPVQALVKALMQALVRALGRSWASGQALVPVQTLGKAMEQSQVLMPAPASPPTLQLQGRARSRRREDQAQVRSQAPRQGRRVLELVHILVHLVGSQSLELLGRRQHNQTEQAMVAEGSRSPQRCHSFWHLGMHQCRSRQDRKAPDPYS